MINLQFLEINVLCDPKNALVGTVYNAEVSLPLENHVHLKDLVVNYHDPPIPVSKDTPVANTQEDLD